MWDYWAELKMLFLRHVWRKRVGWNELRSGLKDVIAEWRIPLVLIENAHHGQPLAAELDSSTTLRLVGPVIEGMKTARVGDVKSAKLERAIASGLLTKLQASEIFLPDVQTVAGVSKWMPEFESELLSWTGRPDEMADQIDVFSYAVDHVRRNALSWGGIINMG